MFFVISRLGGQNIAAEHVARAGFGCGELDAVYFERHLSLSLSNPFQVPPLTPIFSHPTPPKLQSAISTLEKEQ